MKITTNRIPRPLINGCELSEKERAEFDFLKEDELDCEMFFRYRGNVYYLGNFMRYDIEIDGILWHGAQGHSYSNSTLVHICDDHENVIVASAIS
jgi:hypothetical protein